VEEDRREGARRLHRLAVHPHAGDAEHVGDLVAEHRRQVDEQDVRMPCGREQVERGVLEVPRHAPRLLGEEPGRCPPAAREVGDRPGVPRDAGEPEPTRADERRELGVARHRHLVPRSGQALPEPDEGGDVAP
jgi:hypothetical protein